MALSQRPGSRFFAAFYRWSHHTQRTSPCRLPSGIERLPHRPAAFADLRSYHATCPLRGEDESTHNPIQHLQSSAVADAGVAASPTPPVPKDTALKEDVRNLMRRVPSSVAIVTVAHVDPESGEHLPMGIAVSSMTTVTLDPPTISFNIKEPSQTLEAIRASQGCFRVHWLSGKVDSISVIQQFTQGNSRNALRQRSHVRIPQKEDPLTATALSAPQIHAPDRLVAAAECVLTHELPVADHVILVAQIKSVDVSDRSNLAMAYADGSYRVVGPKHDA